jgi:hypothetical protein
MFADRTHAVDCSAIITGYKFYFFVQKFDRALQQQRYCQRIVTILVYGSGARWLYILGLIFHRSSERNTKQQNAYNVNSLIKAKPTTTVCHTNVTRCYNLESGSLI